MGKEMVDWINANRVAYLSALQKSEDKRDRLEKGLISNFETNVGRMVDNFSKQTNEYKKIYQELDYTSFLPEALAKKVSDMVKLPIGAEAQSSNKPPEQVLIPQETAVPEDVQTPKRSSQGAESSLTPNNFEIGGFDFNEFVLIEAQAADELTPKQILEFKNLVNNFFKKSVFKVSNSANLSVKQWTAALASYAISMYEQGTSTSNADNNNLYVTLSLGDEKFEWNRAALTNVITSHFRDKYSIANAERRFMKGNYSEVQKLFGIVGFKPSERLPTKWGVVGGNRGKVSDATPLYKASMSADQQTASMAAQEYATSKGNKVGNIVHTSQVLGSNIRRT